MAKEVNKLVAAILASGRIAKLDDGAYTPELAVSAYRNVLHRLELEDRGDEEDEAKDTKRTWEKLGEDL